MPRNEKQCRKWQDIAWKHRIYFLSAFSSELSSGFTWSYTRHAPAHVEMREDREMISSWLIYLIVFFKHIGKNMKIIVINRAWRVPLLTAEKCSALLFILFFCIFFP